MWLGRYFKSAVRIMGGQAQTSNAAAIAMPQPIPRAEASRASQHSTFSTSLATSSFDVHIQGRRTRARAFTYHASKAPPTLPRTRRVYRARFVISATMRPMVMYLEPAECNRA